MPRLAFLAACLLFGSHALAQAPRIIDTHVHLENPGPSRNFAGAVESAIGRMDRFGIERILLSPPPMLSNNRFTFDVADMRSAIKAYPGRVWMIGGGGTLNALLQDTRPDRVDEGMRRRFRSQAEELLAAGAIGFGEIAIHHLSIRQMGPNHPYESIPADHPLLLLLADVAAERGVPLDLHFDLVPVDMPMPERPIFNPGKHPAELRENMSGFERLLSHNRKANVLWAHAGTEPLGMRVPQIQRELLSRHPNLHMSLRMNTGGPMPFLALDEAYRIKPDWLQLLKDFPDRFVIGTD
jgi:hypothetical protein